MKIRLLFVLALFYFKGESQTNIKYQSPTDQDINYSSCDFEPNADAVILKETASLTIKNESAYFDIKRRIKILTDKGKEEAVYEILFYKSNKLHEKVINLKASTINYLNGKKVVKEVDKKDFFREQVF